MSWTHTIAIYTFSNKLSSRDIDPIKVSILETVPNWIVGEIILIDDASDDRNMLLELDQIDVSKRGCLSPTPIHRIKRSSSY